ncbi:MAG: hypothetical protein V1818_04280 [Candidatus Aenigmatarchaeota archaeon]
MDQKLNSAKIVYGAALFSISVILIGYFVPELEPYAAIIAAFSVGVYAGYGSSLVYGMANGLIAGLAGGLATGLVSSSVKEVFGIPISISITEHLAPLISSITPSSYLFSATMLAVIGLLFGSVGGLLGTIRILKPGFLFAVMFFLFILLGAVDNAAWNIQTPNWTWTDSFSHVFHNEIDIIVAVIFAAFVTVLTYIMNLFKKDEKR